MNSDHKFRKLNEEFALLVRNACNINTPGITLIHYNKKYPYTQKQCIYILTLCTKIRKILLPVVYYTIMTVWSKQTQSHTMITQLLCIAIHVTPTVIHQREVTHTTGTHYGGGNGGCCIGAPCGTCVCDV